MEKPNKTIFIIDDELSVRNALRCLFESVHFNVKAYESAHAFLKEYDDDIHGCLVIDVRMPIMSGLELLEHLNVQKVKLPVIMISGHGDIQMAVRAMKLGAVDFILKPFNDQCLLEIVQAQTNKSLSTREQDDKSAIQLINERMALLSERERQVMHLIAEGKLNKEIAFKLSISMSTVEAHRANIMRKMQVRNLAQLLKLYLKAQFELELDVA
jgi:two-component system response regulator FixJ